MDQENELKIKDLERRIRILEEDRIDFGLTPGEEAKVAAMTKELAALKKARLTR